MLPFNAKTPCCTMAVGTDVAKIPGNYGYKWPKLIELYRCLFSKDFDSQHTSRADVAACMQCFFELADRRLIVLEALAEAAK
jgi:DNA polymerase-3 subunit epsilon